MCQTLLHERESENEGIWIDQLCIDQHNDEEKIYAIPVMDLVYKRARIVVVVLGDICLNRAENTLLQSLSVIYAKLGKINASMVVFESFINASGVGIEQISSAYGRPPGEDPFDQARAEIHRLGALKAKMDTMKIIINVQFLGVF